MKIFTGLLIVVTLVCIVVLSFYNSDIWVILSSFGLGIYVLILMAKDKFKK